MCYHIEINIRVWKILERQKLIYILFCKINWGASQVQRLALLPPAFYFNKSVLFKVQSIYTILTVWVNTGLWFLKYLIGGWDFYKKKLLKNKREDFCDRLKWKVKRKGNDVMDQLLKLRKGRRKENFISGWIN